ncbi:formimidoylglutamase [Cupriavidus basilensis]|uniref:Formimidoylglutamase n=1 Tax=Cupriavidus basilensis TaxID=68895 RepID=A0A0C4Y4P4_9BURK|nr:formimidoylglutamase [Cupriavidus basilensis]AJG20342.1 Formiminoglutamase [Cupriavidus basilensis]
MAAAPGSIWRGRSDAGELGDTRRLFHVVRAQGAERVPGAPVLLGFCCDAGVLRNLGRPGAAGGPREIRRALAGIPAHGLAAFHDAGDVVCHDGDLETAQQALATAVAAELAQGAFPLVLGGGHEIAWGTWQGLRAHLDARGDHGRVLVINLDAHFDLRTGRPGSSGTPFDQIAQACHERGQRFEYACLGVSRLGNTAALFAHAQALGVHYVEDVQMQERHLDARLAELQGLMDAVDHVYLTIDLDVLPAAVMPAVSAPAPYGVPLPVVEEVVALVRASGKLRVADLAEFNPLYDRDACGARAAARLAYRLMA